MAFQRAILLLLLALPTECLVAQVLNMSHDLVTLGIASGNLTPNTPSLDARPLIQAAANYVQNNSSITTLTLDTGNYYLLSNQGDNAVLSFHNSNLTIDFAGSTLFFVGPLLPNGIQLYECSNMTLTNFQTDFLNPPYTHVQLTSVDTTNLLLHYKTLAGWPDPASLSGLVSPFGDTAVNWAAFFRSGSIVPGTTRTVLANPITSGTLAIADGSPWAQAPTLATLQPGDTIVVTARGGGPPLLLWECDGVTFSNIDIYGSPTMAVQVYYSGNTIAQNVRVEPRPVTGLIGSNADGINFFTVQQNDHILNCYVSGTMDDALIMDIGAVGIVVSQNGSRQLTVTRVGYSEYPNGVLLNFVDPNSTLEAVGAHVVSQTPPFSDSPGYGEQVVLTFDQDLPTLAAGVGVVYGDPSKRGQGSTIEDSTVENTYGGHGIWLTGVEGVTVRRNVLRRTSMSGIGIERTTDPVGGLVPEESNITVQSNALEANLGPAACGTGIDGCLAAINSLSTNNQQFAFATQPSTNGLTVANNYVADTGRSGIWFAEVASGTLENNMVIRYGQNPTLNGTAGIPTQQEAALVTQESQVPVVTLYDGTITETGNVIAATSPITAPVTLSPASVTLPAVSWSGSFAVQPVMIAFDWRPFSDSPWLTVTSGAGPGGGSVQYTLAANSTGAPRIGHITVAGESFTVTQSTQATFSPCDLQQNGNIGVVDVQLVLIEALGLGAPINDLNGDALVNVVDVQIEANAVLGGACVK